MEDYDQTETGPAFEDRKTWLVVFGVLLIILGGISALMAPLAVIGAIMAKALEQRTGAPAADIGAILAAVLVYVAAAVWFIWMGVGSIRARRWARALLLVSSWPWLIGGSGGMAIAISLMPTMVEQLRQDPQIPQEMAYVVISVMVVVMLFIYVLLPALLVTFYGGKNVKATCEHYDPQVRWTDKCPLPVLTVSVVFCGWALTMPLMGCYGWVFPFFGTLLSGAAGAGVALVVMLLSAGIAWGAYKLRLAAWWGAILLSLAWGLSGVLTFSRVSLMEMYEKMNYSPAQLEQLERFAFPQEYLLLLAGLPLVAVLGYLLYVKKYFEIPSEQERAL